MMNISSNLEEKIKVNVSNLLIKNGFSIDPFSIKQEDLWRIDHTYRRFDICIYRNNQILALIEIAPSIQWMRAKEVSVRQWLEKTDATYGIITNGQTFQVIVNSRKPKDIKTIEFKSLLKLLKRKKRLNKFHEKIQKCTEIIKKLKSGHKVQDKIELNNDNQISFTEKIQKCTEIIKKLKSGHKVQDKIELNNDNQISFTEKNESIFFNSILSLNKNTKTIYRYTSLKTLFSILETQKYRMCGLAGMNDKTEKDYFDNYIGKSSEVENNIFISSCSLLRDDLTMWRLYGDDGNGVCLAFEIPKEMPTDFNLLKIDYGDKSKKHEKIDLLKELLNCNFAFKDLNRWKHFFKGYEYKKEREIRLLFCNKSSYKSIERNWIITSKSNIINPVIDLPLNEIFPLTLKSIRLGPKFPEKILNINQLKEMLNDKKLEKVKIYKSKITSYR